jgi:hypothetical protein
MSSPSSKDVDSALGTIWVGVGLGTTGRPNVGTSMYQQ